MPMTIGTATIQTADSSNNPHNITLTGNLTGTGSSLTETGGGVLTLGGTNSYIGPTLVSGGDLEVDGSLGSSPVTVNSGALLGGTGNITNTVTLQPGGGINLGSAISTLTVANLTWNTNGAASMLFTLSTTDSTSSLLDITGGLTKGTSSGNPGQFIFNFQDTGMFGGVYTLLEFTPGDGGSFTTSDFAAINVGHNAGGAFNFDNTDGMLTFNLNVVPEPSTWALMVGGATFLIGVWRRRNRQGRAGLSVTKAE